MFSSKQLSVLLILSLFFALFNVQGALANENNAKGIGLELGAVGGFPIGVGASARVSYPFDIEDLSFEAGVNSALFPAFYFFGGELFGSVDIDGRLYFCRASCRNFFRRRTFPLCRGNGRH